MIKRRRFKQTKTLEQRLVEEAERFRQAAEVLPQGTARERLMGRARQAEAAARMDGLLRSPNLQPR